MRGLIAMLMGLLPEELSSRPPTPSNLTPVWYIIYETGVGYTHSDHCKKARRGP